MPESSEIDANHIRRLAEAAGLPIDADEAEDYAVAVKGYLGAFDAIPSFPEPAPPPPVDRRGKSRASATPRSRRTRAWRPWRR